MSLPTNNLISNVLINYSAGVKPVIGEGATVCWYTDRHAATVTKQIEHKTAIIFEVQEDKATRVGKVEASDSQDYTYEADPLGRVHQYRWNENKKRWDNVRFDEETKRWKLIDGGTKIVWGRRDEYYDYSF